MPRLSNQEIKRLAYQAVIKFEQNNGRTAEVVEKDGYDIRSCGRGGERHIEVKGSISEKPTHIGIEASEFEEMQNNNKWFLYIVRNVGKTSTTHVFSKDDVLRHLSGIHYEFIIRFRLADFQ